MIQNSVTTAAQMLVGFNLDEQVARQQLAALGGPERKISQLPILDPLWVKARTLAFNAALAGVLA
jgi:hypothetical protein